MFNRTTNPPCFSALVLVYHSISQKKCDPWDLSVSPSNFQEHIAFLKSIGSLYTVTDLINSIKEPSCKPTLRFAITFDDGYSDNFQTAKPILESMDVPATFYLCPQLLNTPNPFWWDSLLDIFTTPLVLPDKLTIPISGKLIPMELGAASLPVSQENLLKWSYNVQHLHPRLLFYCKLWNTLLPLSSSDRNFIIGYLQSWSGVDLAKDSSRLPLSLFQASELASSRLFEIGAHTSTHPDLTSRSHSECLNEINGSKDLCSFLFNRDINTFSFPFGRFNRTTVRDVIKAGFSSACIVKNKCMTPSSSRFTVPRVGVSDLDALAFESLIFKLLAS